MRGGYEMTEDKNNISEKTEKESFGLSNELQKFQEQEPITPKLTTEEKCRFCINCDVDGKTCIAKIEAPFGSFVCENNEKFEPYEE